MQNEFSEEYLRVLRSLTPSERWDTARKLYWQARALRAEVLKQQHPDWDDARIEDCVRRLFLYAGD